MARSSSLLCSMLLVSLLFGLASFRGQARASQVQELQLRPPYELRSMSVRYPWRGHLVRGMRLSESPLVRHVEEYLEHDRFYGTWQLVQLMQRATTAVADQYPGARLSVGELSAENGGLIIGHHSHRNGRDIDVAFYLKDDEGNPAEAPTFVHMSAHGNGHYAGRALHFDDERNWAMLAKLVSDDDARVQFVFVARSLQWRLVSYAKRIGAPDWLIARARAVMIEPTSGNRHQTHFHVRIYCPADDRPSCQDKPPYFPWYDGVPPGGFYAAVAGSLAPEL